MKFLHLFSKHLVEFPSFLSKAFRELHSPRAIGKVLAWMCNYSETVNLTKLKWLIFQEIRKSFWGFTGLQLDVCWSGLLCWWRMWIHAELVMMQGCSRLQRPWLSEEVQNSLIPGSWSVTLQLKHNYSNCSPTGRTLLLHVKSWVLSGLLNLGKVILFFMVTSRIFGQKKCKWKEAHKKQ